MKIALVATSVSVCSLIWGTALAATAKPMTPTQAAAAISAKGAELQPPSDLLRATCRGTARKSPGRFVAFRCIANLEDGRLTLLARVRNAGGLCWGVSVVPSGCLAPGRRAAGSVTEASRAVYAKFGAPAQSFLVRSHGSGFYSWTWLSGGVEHAGTVTFSPAPVLRVQR